MRNLVGSLTDAWVNQQFASDVRVTVLSMTGQVDDIGQISGSLLIGLIASLFSVPAALTIHELLLTPALPLIGVADRKKPNEIEFHIYLLSGFCSII
jgi:hypothetical protein